MGRVNSKIDKKNEKNPNKFVAGGPRIKRNFSLLWKRE